MIKTLALLAATLVSTSTALACRCTVPDVIQSYQMHDHAVIATAGAMRAIGNYHVYTFTLRKDLKECATAGTVIQVATPNNSGACGTNFTRGETYLLFTDDTMIGGQVRQTTTMCAHNTPAATLSRDDQQYLMNRPLTCGGVSTCVDGNAPLACLVDPCAVSPACPGATCESNTCGGCTAEWYDVLGLGQCMPW